MAKAFSSSEKENSPTTMAFSVDSESPEELLSSFVSDLSFWEISPVDESQEEAAAKKERLIRSLSSVSSSTSSKEEKKKQRRKKKNSQPQDPEEVMWKPATDPTTGRTYYYHKATRATQWEKPAEIRAQEKQKKKEQRKKDLAFFSEMEANVVASLRRGEVIPCVPKGDTSATKQGPPLEPLSQTPQLRVRTISGMDERMLADLRNDSEMHPPTTTTSTKYTPSRGPPIEGRPPLPQRRMHQHEPLEMSENPNLTHLNSLEFSPEFRGTDASLNMPDSDLLAGEHLLDGPLLDSEDGNPDDELQAADTSPPPIHVRRNTGSTIYVKSTMANPDINATIKCVCGVYRAHIVQAASRRYKRSPVSVNTVHVNLDVFCDDYDSLKKSPEDRCAQVPPMPELEGFYQEFYQRSQMEHDTLIMSIIYVERLIKETNGALTPTPENWRSVLFSCMILASKVWDDLSMWNIDFSNVSAASGLSPFSLRRINELEIAVLTCLNFDVKVPASEYAKYYFLIRTMLIRGGMLEDANLPLGKEEAKMLESRTSHYQDSKLKGQRARRARSVDWSWFGSQQQPAGPVLKDKVCLEQIVCMDR